jgi:hypothetical protein
MEIGLSNMMVSSSKGVQEVISYQGLTATPEHIVYLGLDLHCTGQAAAIRQASLLSTFLSRIQNLWRAWNRVSLLKCGRSSVMGLGEPTTSDVCGLGNRSHQQRWTLRAWQLAISNGGARVQTIVLRPFWCLGMGKNMRCRISCAHRGSRSMGATGSRILSNWD